MWRISIPFNKYLGFILIPFFFLFTGCVGSGNIYQDGHTSGAGEGQANVSVSAHLAPYIDIDTTRQELNIDHFRVPVPWAQLQIQFGLADNFDLGANVGVGLLSAGLDVTSKLALLPGDQPLGIALYGSAGFSVVAENVENLEMEYFNTQFALPISYDFGLDDTLVIQPIYRIEWYDLAASENDIWYETDLHYRTPGFGFGWISDLENYRSSIFYNATIIYSSDENQVFPKAGVGLMF